MSLEKVYCSGFRKQTGHYFTHWLPTQTISLGAVGVLEGDVFRVTDTLADFDVDFDPENDVVRDPSPSSFKVLSSKTASVTFKLAGEANPKFPSIPTASAGVGIEFSAEGAFLIQAAEVFEPRIRSLQKLERGILRAYARGQWEKNFAVIYSIIEAPYADIVISESKASSLTLKATADGAVGGVKLGDAEAGFTATNQKGAVLDMTGSRDVTPAFQLLGVTSDRIFREPDIGPLTVGRSPQSRDRVAIEVPRVERLGEPLP